MRTPLFSFILSLALVAGCSTTPAPAPEAKPAAAPAAKPAEPQKPAGSVPALEKYADSEAAPMPEVAAPPKGQGWWNDAIFYEIFVRSFADSDGDGIGDFKGLTAKLDYIKELGADALWLMPIHPSPSYHGYDVLDYQGVNPQYGTMADFEAMLAAAHERGIKIIIDFVINHASWKHPWFLESAKGTDNPKRDYFLWTQEPPDWKRPWDGAEVFRKHDSGDHYYGLFWEGMPDWNMRHPDVRKHMLESMRFWLQKGVDGFRVDAARYLMEGKVDGNWVIADHPDTHSFVKRMRKELSGEFPDALFVAESWTVIDDVVSYFGDNGDEFQLAFNFTMAGGIKGAVNSGTRSSVNQNLRTMHKLMGPDRGFEAQFISNHDMQRYIRDFSGDMQAARSAIALLVAIPGTPFIYYGEEIGMRGGDDPKDEHKRTPMRWTAEAPNHGFSTGEKLWEPVPEEPAGVDVASQSADDKSLLSLYKTLLKMRRNTEALRRGKTSQPKLKGGGRGALTILREAGDQRILAVYNIHKDPTPKPIEITIEGTPEVLLQEGLQGTPKVEGGVLKLDGIDGRGFVFLKL